MKIAIFALLAIFAFSGATAFFFPDDSRLNRPFRPFQWLNEQFNGNARPASRPGWQQQQQPQQQQQQQPQQQTSNSFYPPHPSLVAPRPSYLGNHHRPQQQKQQQSEFIPEITQGRLPEFSPEDYLR